MAASASSRLDIVTKPYGFGPALQVFCTTPYGSNSSRSSLACTRALPTNTTQPPSLSPVAVVAVVVVVVVCALESSVVALLLKTNTNTHARGLDEFEPNVTVHCVHVHVYHYELHL